MQFDLPYPPTVNHYWRRNRDGSMRLGKNGKVFKQHVSFLARQVMAGRPPLDCPLRVSIVAHAPDKRQRDLDNLNKALLDSLAAAGIYSDDSLIHDLRIRWGEMRPKAGGVVVSVEPLDAPAASG